MKKILFYCFFIFSFNSFSQGNSFELTNSKKSLINQFIVLNVDNLSQSDGYKKINDWIKRSYSSPENVIKSTIENEYIKINGFSEELTNFNFDGKTYSMEGYYTLTFEFRPNKIKIEIISLYRIYNGKTIDFGNAPNEYYSAAYKEIPKTLNNLVSEINNYIKNGAKDDW